MSTFLITGPLALLLAAPAGQGDPAETPATINEAEPPALSTERPVEPVGDDKSNQPQMLDPAELDGLRGGQTIVVGNQTLTAVTTGNVLNGDYTAGSVTLSDSAFANFNGLGNLAINTGAQVSLQSGMSVVINIAP